MKMHFGQLQDSIGRIKATGPLKAGVPAWVPPAPVIDQINRMQREKDRKRKAPKDERPRVEIPIDERDPREPGPDCPEPEDKDRGVAILELKG